MSERYPDSKNRNSIEEGLQFQDFVTDVLAQYGIIVQNYASRKWQFEKGENRQGFEVKLDNLCTETGRLSIEIAERTAINKNWLQSGIYRGDSSFYLQGNETRFWLFFTHFLQALHRSGKYKEKEEPTVKAFYLPIKDANKYGIGFGRTEN